MKQRIFRNAILILVIIVALASLRGHPWRLTGGVTALAQGPDGGDVEYIDMTDTDPSAQAFMAERLMGLGEEVGSLDVSFETLNPNPYLNDSNSGVMPDGWTGGCHWLDYWANDGGFGGGGALDLAPTCALPVGVWFEVEARKIRAMESLDLYFYAKNVNGAEVVDITAYVEAEDGERFDLTTFNVIDLSPDWSHLEVHRGDELLTWIKQHSHAYEDSRFGLFFRQSRAFYAPYHLYIEEVLFMATMGKTNIDLTHCRGDGDNVGQCLGGTTYPYTVADFPVTDSTWTCHSGRCRISVYSWNAIGGRTNPGAGLVGSDWHISLREPTAPGEWDYPKPLTSWPAKAAVSQEKKVVVHLSHTLFLPIVVKAGGEEVPFCHGDGKCFEDADDFFDQLEKAVRNGQAGFRQGTGEASIGALSKQEALALLKDSIEVQGAHPGMHFLIPPFVHLQTKPDARYTIGHAQNWILAHWVYNIIIPKQENDGFLFYIPHTFEAGLGDDKAFYTLGDTLPLPGAENVLYIALNDMTKLSVLSAVEMDQIIELAQEGKQELAPVVAFVSADGKLWEIAGYAAAIGSSIFFIGYKGGPNLKYQFFQFEMVPGQPVQEYDEMIQA